MSSGFEVGYSERIITPPMGVDLAGYGFYLDRRASSVLDDLKARALLIRRGSARITIVSCDLIGFSVDFALRLRERTAAVAGCRRAEVLLACTHTHSGPATKRSPGLGKMSAPYIRRLQSLILDAVGSACEAQAPARFSVGSSVIEPLGFNRRTGRFHPIDPVLKVGVFEGKGRRIYLVSYACHPVTLGRSTQVSSDWPGAMAAEIAAGGDACIFLQGCSGDIDPVTNLNGWGTGTADDLYRCGSFMSARVRATPVSESVNPSIGAAERCVSIPLSVWSPSKIERAAKEFARSYVAFPGAARFAREWKRTALRLRPKALQSAALENVPLQRVTVGELDIIAIPGEPFCEIGLRLQAKRKNTWAIGYANGTIGYIATRAAYRVADDYACYCAPRFQTVFPFRPEIEGIIFRAARALLK